MAPARAERWGQVVAGGLPPVSGWITRLWKQKQERRSRPGVPPARRGCCRPRREGGSAGRSAPEGEGRRLQLGRELFPERLLLGLSQLQLLQGQTLEKAGL